VVTSQNGWRANDRSVVASYAVPGGSIALHRGSAGSVLAWCLIEWNRTVEPLLWPGCWGFAERNVRGSEDVSNHASATAADSCAPRHPLGTAPSANFTPEQITAVHALLNRCVLRGKRLIRWGGDYTGRKDGMHLEVNDGVTEAELDELWTALKAGTPPAGPVLPPAPAGGAAGLRTLSYGMRNDSGVAAWQRWSNAFDWRPPLPLLPVTCNYLDQTAAVVKAAQAQCGIGDSDGRDIGPRSKVEFFNRGARW
jgi:hypothetical protein